MSKVIDMDTWREAQADKAELLTALMDYRLGEYGFDEDIEVEYQPDETVTHFIVAKDRTGPDFLKLREELDMEGRNYTVVSKPPREFDL